MTILRRLLICCSLAFSLSLGSARADNLSIVKVFYDFLGAPSSEAKAQEFLEIASEDWESIGNYSGKSNSREDVVKRLGGISKMIPNLVWEVQEMHEDGDTVIVRSRATGTPIGQFFGVDGEGRSFDIMAIDIHKLKDGLLSRTYHVEDWAGAIRQLKGDGDH